jgi:GGDEF domain-containing protein
MSTYADVTGRVERERCIRHQAETDDLTRFPADGSDLDELLLAADRAMYARKRPS